MGQNFSKNTFVKTEKLKDIFSRKKKKNNSSGPNHSNTPKKDYKSKFIEHFADDENTPLNACVVVPVY